ncbi:hypothetical protein EZMO1_2069 [Endozoicomonas montiporae CL-33]|uniref:Uncharacterized protein n=1 Tax=Endozoicomonas montiporae CL-33 TaxID=570277 RepID=A0A142BBR2_9GAMM|nr:hypothetical protein [Endozoicomonas montiporae]AMO56188.1 hypothetical protein EZMO1_2069 [Endozoicomonas montiporae CL-33]
MKLAFKLFPLLFCLIAVCSLARGDLSKQDDFTFLEYYKKNTTAVESGLVELLESVAGVSLSTLVSMGIWYGVCQTPGIVSGLVRRFGLNSNDKEDLAELRNHFCLQLVPAITTTEVMLAGHVSSWPLEQTWWQPLRLAGAVGMAYRTRNQKLPVVLTYFTAEAGARTVGSTVSSLMLRQTGSTSIRPVQYDHLQYIVLSMSTGWVVGGILYEALIRRGFNRAKAALAFMISASATGSISALASSSMLGLDDRSIARVGIRVGIVTAAAAAAVAVAGAGAGAGAGAAVAVAVGVAAGAGAGAAAAVGAGATTAAGAAVGATTAAGAGAAAAALLTIASWKINSNGLTVRAFHSLILSLALFNSLSNYAIYGDPIEYSLSETAKTQWKKFYAPLDYLSTLFNAM